MNIIGDLERFLASLYPNRAAIGAGLAFTVAVLAVIAWRRGWVGAALRQPRRTLAVLVVALVIGGPIAWWLGSPLFIRTQLIEAPITAGADGATVIAQGSFTGADEFHFGNGDARLVRTDSGTFELRFTDFSVRNGPDLFVVLSPDPNGYAQGALELGALKATDGSFGYVLPAGRDPTDYRSAVIWCRAFSVQFAVAPLEAPAA